MFEFDCCQEQGNCCNSSTVEGDLVIGAVEDVVGVLDALIVAVRAEVSNKTIITEYLEVIRFMGQLDTALRDYAIDEEGFRCKSTPV